MISGEQVLQALLSGELLMSKSLMGNLNLWNKKTQAVQQFESFLTHPPT